MRRSQRYLLYASIVMPFCLHPASVLLAASAISVPPDAHSTAAAVIAAAQDILDSKQAKLDRLNTEEYILKAEFDVSEIEKLIEELKQILSKRIIEAEQAEQEAKIAEQEANEAFALAEILLKEAQFALAAAEEGYRYADAVDASLRSAENAYQAAIKKPAKTEPSTAESAPVRKRGDTDELLKLENEAKQMEKAQKDAELARRTNTSMIVIEDEPEEVDWSVAERAHARAEYLDAVFTDADQRAEEAGKIAEEKIAKFNTAANKATQARMAVEDTQLILADAKEELLQGKESVVQARKDFERLVKEQDHPPGAYYSSLDMNYYYWRDNSGNSGYQFIQPLYIGYWQKEFSYSLYTSHVKSQNNTTDASGSVNTLTDTTLFVSKRNEKPKFIVDYEMGISIPTGKPTLSWSERYARMNEDLVQINEFGKGWQFTPGIAVSRKIGEEDMWTIGTNCTFSTSYDPTSDIQDDDLTPGSEWRKFLRWQHAGQDWQFVGELIHTTNGPTKTGDGSRYYSGDNWEQRLTYNRKLSPLQNLMFYYWRENQGTNNVMPFDNSGGLAHYMGTMWSKKINDKRTFRVTFDVMRTSGSRYAGIHNFYDNDGNPQYTSIDVDGRTKYTAGLGYDINIGANGTLSLDLQKFKMEDGSSTIGQPSTTYNGFNFLLRYARSL